MARVARINAATLATLASAPAIPADVAVSTRGLNNDSVLSWTAPAAPLTLHTGQTAGRSRSREGARKVRAPRRQGGG